MGREFREVVESEQLLSFECGVPGLGADGRSLSKGQMDMAFPIVNILINRGQVALKPHGAPKHLILIYVVQISQILFIRRRSVSSRETI
jgi:hypothetical protein